MEILENQKVSLDPNFKQGCPHCGSRKMSVGSNDGGAMYYVCDNCSSMYLRIGNYVQKLDKGYFIPFTGMRYTTLETLLKIPRLPIDKS